MTKPATRAQQPQPKPRAKRKQFLNYQYPDWHHNHGLPVPWDTDRPSAKTGTERPASLLETRQRLIAKGLLRPAPAESHLVTVTEGGTTYQLVPTPLRGSYKALPLLGTEQWWQFQGWLPEHCKVANQRWDELSDMEREEEYLTANSKWWPKR